MLVMLKSGWPGNFRRTLRKPDGTPVKTLDFAPGQPVKVNAKEAKALESDIGPALMIVRIDERGKPRVVDTDDHEPPANPNDEPPAKPNDEPPAKPKNKPAAKSNAAESSAPKA